MDVREISDCDYNKSVNNYNDEWRALDEVLYRVCRDFPDHRRKDGIIAKTYLIGRTYSTGIERGIKSDGTQGSSMIKLADCFADHHEEIDSLIEHGIGVTEPLTQSEIAEILTAHGKLVQILASITVNGYRPRSFVSKYLHFHNPIFPIYDSVACKEIGKIVPSRAIRDIVFEGNGAIDLEYADYLKRFFIFYRDLSERGLSTSVRSLDYYLMWRASVYPPSSTTTLV